MPIMRITPTKRGKKEMQVETVSASTLRQNDKQRVEAILRDKEQARRSSHNQDYQVLTPIKKAEHAPVDKPSRAKNKEIEDGKVRGAEGAGEAGEGGEGAGGDDGEAEGAASED